MVEIESNSEIEVDEDSEEGEELDDLDTDEVNNFPTVAEKKLRVQLITQEVKKLLSERDDLERELDMLEDDIPVED
ncbi:TPA: hypothetical protein HA371_04995 [Candidatus Woesearchaeota archaeon]|nr:hypothetical protein [Candidatus Woesearchaeota archaeon]